MHVTSTQDAVQPEASIMQYLLYDRVSLPSISVAFLVELSMAAMRDACSLQLFSRAALYRVCTHHC